MTVIAVEPRFTAAEWSRIVADPIRDHAYQRITRLGGAVARYLAWKRPSASARTLEIYEGYLAALCMHLTLDHGDPDLHQVTAEMLLEAAGRHPVGSYKLVRTTYNDFFTVWAEEWEGLPRSPARKLPKARRQPTKVYDIFTPAEQARLIAAADDLPMPWVQRLRILCFVDLGIRLDEGRLLRPTDFDLQTRAVVIREEGAKGGNERVVQFGDDLFRALMNFRNRPVPNVRMSDAHGCYRESRRPFDDDYIFFPSGFHKRSGAVTWTDPTKPYAKRSMGSWWDKVAEAAGVRYRSLHMNRHTLGTNLSDAGEGLETIQDWLGHADPKTTRIYVHNSRTRLQRARGSLDSWRKAQGS